MMSWEKVRRDVVVMSWTENRGDVMGRGLE